MFKYDVYTIKEEENYHTDKILYKLISGFFGNGPKYEKLIFKFQLFASYFLLMIAYLYQIENKVKGMLYLSTLGKYSLDIC